MHISVPRLKWQTRNFLGADNETIATNELLNNRSTIQISSPVCSCIHSNPFDVPSNDWSAYILYPFRWPTDNDLIKNKHVSVPLLNFFFKLYLNHNYFLLDNYKKELLMQKKAILFSFLWIKTLFWNWWILYLYNLHTFKYHTTSVFRF